MSRTETSQVGTGRAGALLEAQKQVLESIAKGSPLAEVLEALCRIVEAQAERHVRAAILLADAAERQLWMGAAPSLPDTWSRLVGGLPIRPDLLTCAAAAARRAAVVTLDIARDPGWHHYRELPLGLGLRAAWSMPIFSSEGKVLGTFGTFFPEARGPDLRERQLVEVLARTAALAIERLRADEATRANVARHRFLADLASATQQLTDPSEVMATTARMLTEHLDVNCCLYAEVENEREVVIIGDYSRGVPPMGGRWPVVAFGDRFANNLLAGKPYVVADTESCPAMAPTYLQNHGASHIRAIIGVPLHKNGKLTALMAVHQASPRCWAPEDVELVRIVVARCWEALERTRVTRALRDSEARYRAMFEASPESVQLIAADGTVLQVNDAGLRILEAADKADVIGKSVCETIAPEFHETYRAYNQKVCSGEEAALDLEVVGLNGTRRWLEVKSVPLPSPSGGFVNLQISRDVTERVAAQRALAQSRARLDYAVRVSGVGFWYSDLPEGNASWDNRVKEHFFLPSDEPITDDIFFSRIHPDDRGPTFEAVEASIRGHVPYDFTYRTVNPDTSEIKWIRALGGAAYDDHGTPIHFDGVTVDMTAQKIDQERLAILLAREQKEGRLLRKVAEAALNIQRCESLDCVLQIISDEARSIIGAHRAVTILTRRQGFSRDLTAASVSDRYANAQHDEQLLAGGLAMYAAVGQTNSPVRMTQRELEAHLARSPFQASHPCPAVCGGWLAVPLVARDGSTLGLVQLSDKYEGDFTDVDEAILIQLAQIAAVALQNVQLCERLREHDRRKDEFLATLAHELRNPLAPIRTGLHVLQRVTDPEQARRTREMMERQLRHLVRMVDDLLDVSRITLGKLTLKKERVDFRSILPSAIETARPLIELKGHDLTIRVPKEPLPIEVDITRLAQVVSNLLNNAAKYTPAGGRIALTVSVERSTLLIQVCDTGVGIPAEMVERVFDMFTQIDGHELERTQGGLGIGLTLVRRLIEMHGGSIEAASPGVGQGSTFTVRLPLVDEEPATRTDAHSLAAGSRTMRILIVDDNVDAAESLSMLLKLSGHEAALAHSGADALAAAQHFRPHVVLLDIGLPGMNGYEVARRLRSQAGNSKTVIIALTGWGSDEDRRRAQEAGFDRHLVKPLDLEKLDSALAACNIAE